MDEARDRQMSTGSPSSPSLPLACNPSKRLKHGGRSGGHDYGRVRPRRSVQFHPLFRQHTHLLLSEIEELERRQREQIKRKRLETEALDFMEDGQEGGEEEDRELVLTPVIQTLLAALGGWEVRVRRSLSSFLLKLTLSLGNNAGR